MFNVLQKVYCHYMLLHMRGETQYFCGGALVQRLVWGVLHTAHECGTEPTDMCAEQEQQQQAAGQGVAGGGGAQLCRLLTTAAWLLMLRVWCLLFAECGDRCL
jgi:hypothetical protein